MARGPKKHFKRLNAPHHWMLSKLGGIYAPRPSPGPHKLRECLPLVLILRNRLKYALNRKECQTIVMRRMVKVDHKIRTDVNFPAGFMDVVTLDKTGENFRLLFDVKGRFTLLPVDKNEAAYKLLRVKKLARGKKASIGRNPYVTGQGASIPYIVTHDGRTIRYPDPDIAVHDTVKFDIKSGKITGFLKFEPGQLVMITKGANSGRIGVIVSRERHPGSFDIVHIRDRKGHNFATRLSNVFVIGEGPKPWISLPRGKGVKLSIIEQKNKAKNKKD